MILITCGLHWIGTAGRGEQVIGTNAVGHNPILAGLCAKPINVDAKRHRTINVHLLPFSLSLPGLGVKDSIKSPTVFYKA